MNKWLVVTGDVDEGFTFYGPFETPEEADEWATSEPFYPQYVLAPLQKAAKGSTITINERAHGDDHH